MIANDFAEPIRTRIDACDQEVERWKEDHELAKILYSFEDLLDMAVQCYDGLQRADRWFTSRMAKPDAEYDEAFDELLIELHRRFHRVSEDIERVIVPLFDGSFDEVEYLTEFRRRLERMRVSKTVGYRKDACHKANQMAAELSESLGLESFCKEN